MIDICNYELKLLSQVVGYLYASTVRESEKHCIKSKMSFSIKNINAI